MSSGFIISGQPCMKHFAMKLGQAIILSLNRSMYTWITTNSTQNPLNTSPKQNAVIAFCIAQNINIIYLDMYNFLGSSNYTAPHVATVQSFIQLCTNNNITVYALAGDTDWSLPATLSFIQNSIITNIQNYNAASTVGQRFAGFTLDVEYWTDVGQTPTDGLTGLLTVIKTMQSALHMPVGCFAPFYLKDATNARTPVSYLGATKQEGAFLLDVADNVVVGAYRNTAAFNNGNGQDGQITLFQPWYDYAKANNITGKLYLGTETTNISPNYTTFFSKTKVAMETQLTISTAAFTDHTVFRGNVVDSYDGWKAMS